MYSTFHGLETAKRAMTAQQSALQTTGHNIANANTPGYTRQRVTMEAAQAFPKAAMNAPMIAGQMGTGVHTPFVERIREQYLDVQYRTETSKTEYWSTHASAMERMEDIMNEPSEHGLANAVTQFWEAAQDLSVQPEDAGARSVMRQRGESLAETFRYIGDSLQANKLDVRTELDITEKNVNSLLSRINEVNTQIGKVEPHGQIPNDLYDVRDNLVDQLSGMLSIEVVRNEGGANAMASAEGKMNIYATDGEGGRLFTLVDGLAGAFKQMAITTNPDQQHEPIDGLAFTWANGKAGTEPENAADPGAVSVLNSDGKLKALVETYGYVDPETNQAAGTYPDMMNDLDVMAETFMNAFNEVHQAGWNLQDIDNKEKGADIPFFTIQESRAGLGAARSISLSAEIKGNLDLIAAASPTANGDGEIAFSGDGSNARALAALKDVRLGFGDGPNTTIQSFYQGVIGEMAVKISEAGQKASTSDSLRTSADNRRMQVSSVSLDEEMVNMIQFQHAYNAAARNITAVDEMLDRIINNMGLVGR